MNPQLQSEIKLPPAPPGMAWWTELVELPEFPPKNLPYDDGEPLESEWHRGAMNLLIDVVRNHFRERTDFFCGGNMFLYFNMDQLRDRDFRGPDFFFVWGVERHRLRHYYAIWEEGGRYPNVLLELLSPTTAEVDRTVKREIYQNTFRTSEYFLCDPETGTIEGLRMANAHYQPIAPDERGWLWSEQLQLWLGSWTGTWCEIPGIWPRFYDASGRLLPTFNESAQQNLDAAQHILEQEKQRAEQEKQRADNAETENARLRRELEELRRQFPQAGK